MELPHSVFELMGGHEHASPLTGAAAGAIGALAAVRGVQNLKIGGTIHNLEGLGNLALAASSGLTAYEMFTGGEESHGHHGHHGHSHGLGTVGMLEVAHGLAEIAVGGLEFKQGKRKGVSLLRMAKGSAVLMGQFVPSIAPVAGLLHLGTTIATTIADPTH